MKISGFFIIRNGTKFDYPYLESLRSILPLVDEFVVCVGKSEDDTLHKIQDFSRTEGLGKIQIFQTVWPIDLTGKLRDGQVLAEQTNLALEKCTGDWCFYIQADEVFHEDDLTALKSALVKYQADPSIEGLLFDYHHFYGSFDIEQYSRSNYRREVRVIKKSSGAQSVGDAQSFRKADGSKLSVASSGARIFHYGWVRTPQAMKEKTFFMDQLYHGKPDPEKAAAGIPHTGENYRYKKILGLRRFTGTHPAVMKARITAKNWHWDFENSPLVWTVRDAKKILLDGFERLTGIRLFEYRSYRRAKAK